MSYWKKQKKTPGGNFSKKNPYYFQSLASLQPKEEDFTKKKSLQYFFLFKKFDQKIDYKNVNLLRAFLNKYGKIRPRRKTKIPVQKQRTVSKAIRKARACGILPFTCDFQG